MLKRQAGNRMELSQQANGQYLEHRQCERVRGVYQTICSSGLEKFTFSQIDALYRDLNTILGELDRLPENLFRKFMEVIDRLSEGRNELRLARFLFDVEEINPVHRLILRNKAVLRSSKLLGRVLQAWPVDTFQGSQKTQEDV